DSRNPVHHGFLYTGGAFRTIDVPGASDTQATGINNAGQIVGTFFDGTTHGFVYAGGTFTTIDVPDADVFTGFINGVNGINDTGHVVGATGFFTSSHGFLDVNGTFSPVDVPGAMATLPSNINNAG